MSNAITILITGHGEAEMDALQKQLNNLSRVKTSQRILKGDESDFWKDANYIADILIHFLGADAEKELNALARLPQQKRPSALIVCNHSVVSAQLVRLAMQTGACDFVMGAQLIDDTLAIVRKFLEQHVQLTTAQKTAITTAVVNVRGGAGASTLARSLAHAFVTEEGLQTLLLDLDFQFSSQCLELGLTPQQGLVEALVTVETLDKIALMGYTAKHAGGLSVLSPTNKDILLPGEVDAVRFSRLMDLMESSYAHLVIDLPRLIDPIFNLVMEKADQIIVVMRQDISNLRDANRMIQILTTDMGVPVERILPIVNRYEENIAISLEDVKRNLSLDSVITLPNDFKRVRMAANLGVPVAEYAPKSRVTLSVNKLAAILSGKKRAVNQGWLKKMLSSLLAEATER